MRTRVVTWPMIKYLGRRGGGGGVAMPIALKMGRSDREIALIADRDLDIKPLTSVWMIMCNQGWIVLRCHICLTRVTRGYIIQPVVYTSSKGWFSHHTFPFDKRNWICKSQWEYVVTNYIQHISLSSLAIKRCLEAPSPDIGRRHNDWFNPSTTLTPLKFF